MIRALLLLSLIACADGPRRPPRLPADPNAVENCRSSPIPLGGVRYNCGSYEVLDNTTDHVSIRSIEYELVKRARDKGIAERCNEKVAACGLAAVAYVEATLCR